MNNLLALMHDTMRNSANIESLCFLLLNDASLSEDEKKKHIEKIQLCNKNLTTTIDRFYTDNKQN